MRRFLLAASILGLMAVPALAQEQVKVRVRADALEGTPLVIVISHLKDDITKITCDKWVMLGQKSWNNQNNFTIPGAPGDHAVSIAVMNTKGFDGYCKGQGSVIAHTDNGSSAGELDNGNGNFSSSTTLTFGGK